MLVSIFVDSLQVLKSLIEQFKYPIHHFYEQENMTRMLMVTDVQDIIKRHQAQIITSLKDPDIRLHFTCALVFT